MVNVEVHKISDYKYSLINETAIWTPPSPKDSGNIKKKKKTRMQDPENGKPPVQCSLFDVI